MVVFDLDDTLFKEIDYVKSAYRAIAGAIGRADEMHPELALTILEESESTEKGLDDLSAVLWQHNPDTQFKVPAMVEIYRTHVPDISLSPGAKELLDSLKEKNIAVGLITDGRPSTQRAKIEALRLTDYIAPDNILISGETGADKTQQTPFRMMMERNPAEQRFVYVGDNPAKDFRWPNALGWLTVQLDDPEGVNIHSQAIDVPADFRAARHIDRLADLLPLLSPAR